MFSNLCDKYISQREKLEKVVAYVGYQLNKNIVSVRDKVAYVKKAVEANMLMNLDYDISDEQLEIWKRFYENYKENANG